MSPTASFTPSGVCGGAVPAGMADGAVRGVYPGWCRLVGGWVGIPVGTWEGAIPVPRPTRPRHPYLTYF